MQAAGREPGRRRVLSEGGGGTAPEKGLLRIESGFYEGLEWPLDRASTVIGRGRSADLILQEATISRAHALLGYEGERLFVQDLGSTNGTLVNGVREDRALLSDGDEVRIGRLVLRVVIGRGDGKHGGTD